jgi:hypothetical protein
MAATAVSELERRPRGRSGGRRGEDAVLLPWVRSQALNATRHAAHLRPFTRGEFGRGPEAPTIGHLQAANELITRLRGELLAYNEPLRAAAREAAAHPAAARLDRLLTLKERSHQWVRACERVWNFYFELFGQRQSSAGELLLACDRIALDCYTAAFMGQAASRSIPAPPPFSYMRTGFSPATYRRGVPMRSLGRLPNVFPLVELPFHRLVNPWTLGAVLHEVSHNLQTDLGLDTVIPRVVAERLTAAGHPPAVTRTLVSWNRETFADLSGLLLGGPGICASLMDVVGRSRDVTYGFVPGAVHPTPYLRPPFSFELLRRMGFEAEAERYRRAWGRLFPSPPAGAIPSDLLRSFPQAVQVVVDAMCFTPLRALGGRSLADSYRFEAKDQTMIEEAARRLTAGTDPGVIPARYLIGACRFALDRRLGRPGVLARNFYRELVRR